MADDSKKVEKYITEIKELPDNNVENDDQVVKARTKQSTKEVENAPKKPQEKPVVTEKQPQDKKQETSTKDVNIEPIAKEPNQKKSKSVISEKFGSEKTKKKAKNSDFSVSDDKSKFPLSTKDIILGIINLISLILLVILLTRLPEKAQTLKKLRNDSLIDESSVRVQSRSVEENEEQAQRLENVFLDESGVVDFVSDIENLRSEGGTITELSFENQTAVKDKTGAFGIPTSIILQGTWEQIGSDLERIETLPYLFRPVKILARPVEIEGEEEGEVQTLIEFQYGGVLYVDQNLAEN